MKTTLRPLLGIIPSSWKTNTILGLEHALYWTGVSSAYVKLRSVRGATILMYHSVADSDLSPWIYPDVHTAPEVFESQIRFLAKNRRTVSLSELIDELEGGQTPPAGTVAITFDDGYLDNLTVAAPILARYDLPSTWYLPTGEIQRGNCPWSDQLYTAFSTRSRQTLSLEGMGVWNLQDGKQYQAAFSQIAKYLTISSFERREALLVELQEQLQSTATPPRLRLSWDEIRKTVRDFPRVDMGIHSTNHLDLSQQTLAVAREEIECCIADFQREMGWKPQHFAFPYNRHTPETCEILSKLGLRSAMGSSSNVLLQADTERFAISRIDPPPSPTLFRFYTSGAFPDLPETLFGRAV